MNIEKEHHIFADIDLIEKEAQNQFESAMNQDFVVKGAIMPDCHAGYSLPIGAVVATRDYILPAWVGYDIGCGMCALPTNIEKGFVEERKDELFKSIYRSIPVGFNHNKENSAWGEIPEMTDTARTIFDRNGLMQLASLGGGNHFIEIGYDEDGKIWIIIHSGSRGIGHAVASHYMRLASGDGKAREGHFGFDVNSQSGKDYILDLNFCLEFALENRKKIIARVERELSFYCNGEGDWSRLINRNHNHAELKDGLWIHRKGATHAENGMMGVIPGNMRDGSFIVRGKGNPDSLFSSSHGAGRVLGRKQAQRELNIEDFEKAMIGVTAKIDKETLDESPFAYKNIFEVMSFQKELVETLHHVRPMINIKG
ncbi:MAG: RtcB family protein [Spirochaetia bacterium]|nr:RtcB family protein [Spirochaetia bacterium]